jgi:signal transduction histidine kinase
VLLIDDDRDDYLITHEHLKAIPGNRYQLDWEPDYHHALELVCQGKHDVYLLDYRLGVYTGLDLLKTAQQRGCVGPIILLTGMGSGDLDLTAMEAGAADFLEKSRLDPVILERAIRYALQQRRAEQDLEAKVKARTEELDQLNQKLREADARKDEFLATLAHELRNPLAPIRNAIEIMRLAANNPQAIEQCRLLLERQVNQLIRLVDDLLDVSRITRGKLRLNLELLTLNEVLTAAIEMSQPVLDKAKVRFEVAGPVEPVRVRGDRVRLAQIFSNLLNNAAKYTPAEGHVLLSVTRSATEVMVSVRDTGEGIPTEMLPRLFELFTQVDRTLNRAQGGLGIGLALIKTLVEMHGGTVSATSAGVGQGAEFTVRLPVPSESGVATE